MSNLVSDQDRVNREAQSIYHDSFKHMSTLVIGTSLLTAALFRDSLSNVPVMVFVGFGLSFVLSLYGLYFTTVDYPKNLGISSFTSTVFSVDLIAFSIGFAELLFSPVFQITERFSPFLVIIVSIIVALIFIGIGMYSVRRMKRTLNERKKRTREAFRNLQRGSQYLT